MTVFKKISGIQSTRTVIDKTDLYELERADGTAFKVEHETLLKWVRENIRQDWIQKPGYTIDEVNFEITIDATGRALVGGIIYSYTGDVLTYTEITTPGVSRFDALVYNINASSYEIIEGQTSATPVTPSVVSDNYLFVAYLLVDDTGVEVPQSENEHAQNTDQFLDFGGANQVSAADIKALVANPPTGGEIPDNLYFTGDFEVNTSTVTTFDKQTFIKKGATSAQAVFSEDLGEKFEMIVKARADSGGVFFSFTNGTTITNDLTGASGGGFLAPGETVLIESENGNDFYHSGELQGNSAPTAIVGVNGDKKVGETLTASVLYDDDDDDLENLAARTYQWQTADDSGGTPDLGTIADIGSATSSSYLIPPAMEAKFIRLEVHIYALTGVLDGGVHYSEWFLVSGVSAGAFHPTDLASLEFFYDARGNKYQDTAGTIVAGPGDPVRAIRVTKAGGATELWTEEDSFPTAINWGSYQALLFDNNDRLTAPNGVTLEDVVNPKSTSDNFGRVVLYENLDGSTINNWLLKKYDGNMGMRDILGGATGRKALTLALKETESMDVQSDTPNTINTAYLSSVRTILANPDDGSGKATLRAEFFEGGELKGTQNPGGTGNGVGSGTTAAASIGGTGSMAVRIGFIAYIKGNSIDDLNKLESWAANEFGRASLLHAGHPYPTIPSS